MDAKLREVLERFKLVYNLDQKKIIGSEEILNSCGSFSESYASIGEKGIIQIFLFGIFRDTNLRIVY